MADQSEIATALRTISKGFAQLAEAIAAPAEQPKAGERERALLREWGGRGLSRAQASVLFRKHGFAPQTAGGWARGDWIETREDGLRYVTERSQRWLAEEEGDERD
jgi:hypothetical protein